MNFAVVVSNGLVSVNAEFGDRDRRLALAQQRAGADRVVGDEVDVVVHR